MIRSFFVVMAALASLLVVHSTFAVTAGQLDDFQDGTTMNWTVALGPGGGNPPFVPAPMGGGQLGAGDIFMLLTSTGGMGAGGRLVVLNDSQWAGDYLAAGITGISMDVNNMSGLPLDLRMRFEHFSAPGPPTGDFLSGNAITIGPQSGWQSVFFPITESHLVDLTMGAGDDYATTMSDIGVVRLMHAPTHMLPPPEIDALLGVDNILAVPEPSGLACCLGLVLVLVLLGRPKSN